MTWPRVAGWIVAALGALVIVGSGAPRVEAQLLPQQAGVVVDAEGVLHKRVYADPTGELTRQRLAAARASLSPQLAEKSSLRKVSLNRLERAIADELAARRPLTDAMRYLAGMTRLTHVFYYPETQDIVIAGPAEGWAEDLSGRVCGVYSGRPVLELQDLVVALRTFSPDATERPVIGCSIDPTPEGLARMQEFLGQIGQYITPDDTEQIVSGLRSALGMQQISIQGVPADTHFAQVMVEADYRMKLIGIGLEKPPVRLASYVERANPAQVSRNALQRWYFTPDYECVRVSDDGLSMQLLGEGVKLVGADEVVGPDGARRQASGGDRASKAFVTGFTKMYPALAERSPVYAQLRNLIDMAIAAAYIQQQDFYGQAGWHMPVFGREEAFPVQTYPAPRQVETVVTSIWKANRLMTPLGGGVTVQAWLALAPENVQADEEGTLTTTREKITLDLAEGQWWWD